MARSHHKGAPSMVGKVAVPGDKPLFTKGADGRYRFAKGHAKVPGAGYQRGGRYKRTPGIAKELMLGLVQYGLEYGKAWLEATAKRSPAQALDVLAKLAEYTQPKLSRGELGGPGGGPVVIEVVTVDSLPPPRQRDTVVADPSPSKE